MNEFGVGNEDENDTGFRSGVSWQSVSGAVVWSSGGAVRAALFYAAGEVLRGPVRATHAAQLFAISRKPARRKAIKPQVASGFRLVRHQMAGQFVNVRIDRG